MGITVRTRAQVTAIDSDGVSIGDERVEATTVLWAAGVCASPLVATLGLDTDRQGRLRVEQDCSIPGHPDIFCIGDAAVFIATGETQPLPGVSPVAMQQGRFVARLIIGNINSNSKKAISLS